MLLFYYIFSQTALIVRCFYSADYFYNSSYETKTRRIDDGL